MWKISSFANFASLAQVNRVVSNSSSLFMNSTVTTPVDKQMSLIVLSRGFATPKKDDKKPAGLFIM